MFIKLMNITTLIIAIFGALWETTHTYGSSSKYLIFMGLSIITTWLLIVNYDENKR